MVGAYVRQRGQRGWAVTVSRSVTSIERASHDFDDAITAGASRVAYGPLCLHAVANTPAGLMEFIRSYFPSASAFSETGAGRLLH
jgi:hypothetical protein